MPDIAFVMDPLDTLALKKDSTLAMIRAAQMRGWDITYLLARRPLLPSATSPWRSAGAWR